VGGRSLLDRVYGALAASSVETTYAVTSPRAPETAARAPSPVIETPGNGYVADLQRALADERVSRPVLTVTADLPLLEGDVVDTFLSTVHGRATMAAVPAGRVRGLGFSLETVWRNRGIAVRPAGLNVVGPGSDRVWVTRDCRLAAHVNRPRDLSAAAWLLPSAHKHKG
jgi:adenosylcobinamide-phosphate guanylyltransferase